MSDRESRFIPNSFQVPNVYVDEIYPLLDHEEQAMLIYACRRIFGWQKRTDRIAASQFETVCDLHPDTVTARLKSLEQFRIMIQVSKNDPHTNKGPEWALQLDDEKVDWNGLRARKAEKAEKNRARVAAARAKVAENKAPEAATTPPCPTDLPLSDIPTPTLSDRVTPYPVGQGTQNTETQDKSNMAAEAPARAEKKKGDMLDGMLAFAMMGADPTVALKARISEYPADVQSTIQSLAELYHWPAAAIPAKPARSGKGGAFAQWINEARQINQIIAGHGRAALVATTGPCRDLSIGHPAAILWCLGAEVGKLARRQTEAQGNTGSILAETIKTFTPRGQNANV